MYVYVYINRESRELYKASDTVRIKNYVHKGAMYEANTGLDKQVFAA